jgi:hypothetical protein
VTAGHDLAGYVLGVGDNLVVYRLCEDGLSAYGQDRHGQQVAALAAGVADVGAECPEVLERRPGMAGSAQVRGVLADGLFVDGALDLLQPVDEPLDPGVLASGDYLFGQAVIQGEEADVPQARTLGGDRR